MLGNITIKSRLIFVIGFLPLQLVVGGIIGIFSQKQANDPIRTLYQDRMSAMRRLDQLAGLMHRNQTLAARAAAIDATEPGRHRHPQQ